MCDRVLVMPWRQRWLKKETVGEIFRETARPSTTGNGLIKSIASLDTSKSPRKAGADRWNSRRISVCTAERMPVCSAL
ncbi:MAG: hypothetical protein ACLTR6_05335 [Clostridium fessum]